MTTGSKTSDFSIRNYMFKSKSGNQWVNDHLGTISVTRTKTWNGTNRATSTTKNAPGDRTTRKYRSFTWKRDASNRPYKSWFTGKFRTRPPQKAKRKIEDNSPHPYSMSLAILNDQLVILNSTSEWSCWDISAWSESVSYPLEFDSNDQIKLVNKLKDKFAGSDFNMAVFLGEGHQTVSMIGKAAASLAQAYLHTRKGNMYKAAQSLGVSWKGPTSQSGSSAWLQLMYGWLPLFGDMKSGAEQLAHILTVPKRKRYSVRIAKAGKAEYDWNFATNKYVLRRQLVAYVDMPPSNLAISGLLDPELVAWELTPFSFVVDWFYQFGNYLEARALAQKLSGTFVTTDTRDKHTRVCKNQRLFPTNKVSANTAEKQNYSVTRTVSTTLSVSLPKTKTLVKAASWQHMANGIALATQVFSGKGSPKGDQRLLDRWFQTDRLHG